jgi:hypothetical protein
VAVLTLKGRASRQLQAHRRVEGERGGVCGDAEALYFKCVHRDTEGRVERYKRATVRIGHHTIVTEMPEHTNAR